MSSAPAPSTWGTESRGKAKSESFLPLPENDGNEEEADE